MQMAVKQCLDHAPKLNWLLTHLLLVHIHNIIRDCTMSTPLCIQFPATRVTCEPLPGASPPPASLSSLFFLHCRRRDYGVFESQLSGSSRKECAECGGKSGERRTGGRLEQAGGTTVEASTTL